MSEQALEVKDVYDIIFSVKASNFPLPSIDIEVVVAKQKRYQLSYFALLVAIINLHAVTIVLTMSRSEISPIILNSYVSI